jgi:AmiR/NasT family two-component response regulator
MKPQAILLIAAEPGPLPLALQALLLSLPQVDQVYISSRQADIVDQLAAHTPTVVILIDAAHPRRQMLPEVIRGHSPGSRIVFLVNGDSPIEGADLVLQQGAHPEELVSALISMLA